MNDPQDGECTQEIPCNDIDDNGNGEIDEGDTVEMCSCGRATEKPVDLMKREMSLRPLVLAHINSGISAAHDLVFAMSYESRRAREDWADDQLPASTEVPYARVLGPGMRHSFSDRLILVSLPNQAAPANPGYIAWESMAGTVRLYPTGIAGAYKSDPGTQVRAQRSGSVWRLRDGSGDVLEFNDMASATFEHPWGSGIFHAQLGAVYPNGASGFRFVVQHENDPVGTGGSDIPTGGCDQIVDNVNGCVAARGLLVRIAAQWRDAGTWRSTQALEFKYGSQVSGSKLIFSIARVLASTDRADGAATAALPALAHLSFESASGTRRLKRVVDGLLCAAGAVTPLCQKAVYTYATSPLPSWAITAVHKPIVSTNGTTDTAGLAPEEEFAWSLPGTLVSHHASQHQNLDLATYDVVTRRATWTLNGETQTLKFDEDGNPLDCLGDSCGDSNFDQTYALRNGSTLGVDYLRTREGNDLFRTFDNFGHTIFECEVVPTSTASPPARADCRLNGVNGFVRVEGGTLRRAVRSYFSSGDPDNRLMARVEWRGSSSVGAVHFPLATQTSTGWFTSGATPLTAGDCPPVVGGELFDGGSGSIGYVFDVEVYDYDSDGDGILNEASDLATGALGDSALVRVTRASGEAPTGTGWNELRTCRVMPRDAALRVGVSANERQLLHTAGGGLVESQVERTYAAFNATPAKSRGRITMVRHSVDATAPTPTWLTLFTLCSPLSSSIDAEGRVTCVDVPQAPASQRIQETTTTVTTGTYTGARKRRIDFIAGSPATTLLQVSAITAATGLPLESGPDAGNKTRYFYVAGATASVGIAPSERRELRSDGSVFSRSTVAYDLADPNLTWPIELTTLDAAGTIFQKRTLSAYDKVHGLPGHVVDSITSTTDAVTDATYEAWDALAILVEPDDQGSSRNRTLEKGLNGDDATRLVATKRGTAASPTTVMSYVNTRFGELGTARFGAAGATDTTYTYDARRRIASETITGAGLKRVYTYDSADRVLVIDERTLANVSQHQRSFLYDDLGRVLWRCDGGTCTSAAQAKQTFVYDSKGAFAGLWTSPSHTVSLTDTNQKGRLAYFVDENGATFFNYDGLGNVVAVVRHDGPLTSFSAANCTETVYTYNTGTAGASELTQIQYPSTRKVKYVYTADKLRPNEVSVAQNLSFPTLFTRIAGSITYSPLGFVTGWNWAGTSTNPHSVVRDRLGRVTQLQDSYASSVVSNVVYTYEKDGDVLSQADTTTASMDAVGPLVAHPRTYVHNVTRDVLTAFQDVSETQVQVSLKPDGRRASEIIGGVTHGYTWDTTAVERLVSKTCCGASVAPTEVALTWNALGQVTTVDYGANNTPGTPAAGDVLLTYGFAGQLKTAQVTGTGIYTSTSDGLMRRVLKTHPVGGTFTRWRYGLGRLPVEEYRKDSSTTWNRTESIMLGGQVIGYVVETNALGPTILHAITDRMGVVRKTKTNAGVSVNRLVMDATGEGTVVSDTATVPNPLLGWRYPGQYEDEGGIVHNGMRTYLPGVGLYTSVEPLHAMMQNVGGEGPLAFTYAGGRPLGWIDPTGTCFGNYELCGWQEVEPYAHALFDVAIVVGGGVVIAAVTPVPPLAAGMAAGMLLWSADVGNQDITPAAAGAASKALGRILAAGFGAAARGASAECAIVAGAAAGAERIGPRFELARARHIFRDAPGHVNPASASSQARYARLFEDVASNPANLRADATQAGLIAQEAAEAGVEAFTWTGNGGQIWVTVRDGVITNAGVNPLGAIR